MAAQLPPRNRPVHAIGSAHLFHQFPAAAANEAALRAALGGFLPTAIVPVVAGDFTLTRFDGSSETVTLAAGIPFLAQFTAVTSAAQAFIVLRAYG